MPSHEFNTLCPIMRECLAFLSCEELKEVTPLSQENILFLQCRCTNLACRKAMGPGDIVLSDDVDPEMIDYTMCLKCRVIDPVAEAMNTPLPLHTATQNTTAQQHHANAKRGVLDTIDDDWEIIEMPQAIKNMCRFRVGHPPSNKGKGRAQADDDDYVVVDMPQEQKKGGSFRAFLKRLGFNL